MALLDAIHRPCFGKWTGPSKGWFFFGVRTRAAKRWRLVALGAAVLKGFSYRRCGLWRAYNSTIGAPPENGCAPFQNKVRDAHGGYSKNKHCAASRVEGPNEGGRKRQCYQLVEAVSPTD
jgi:hypothetical protein